MKARHGCSHSDGVGGFGEVLVDWESLLCVLLLHVGGYYLVLFLCTERELRVFQVCFRPWQGGFFSFFL